MQEKEETPWRHAWSTRGQTEEVSADEEARGGFAGLQRETWTLTHRRNRRVGRAGGRTGETVGKGAGWVWSGRGGGERSSIIRGKGGGVSQRFARVDYQHYSTPKPKFSGTPHIRPTTLEASTPRNLHLHCTG